MVVPKQRTIKRNVSTPQLPPRRNVPVNPRFVLPVGLPRDQFTVTQEFNRPVDYSNLNPNRLQAHEGIDFAPIGAARDLANIPVVAVENARVTQVREQQGGYGRYVRIEFLDGRLGALYAHLNDVNVREGQTVNAGDVIGTMGSSGRSTGRHLHFNLLDLTRERGNYIYPQVIDPTPFLSGSSEMQYQTPRMDRREVPSPTPLQQISKVRPKVQTVISQQGDYPPNMPATNDPNVGMTSRFFPPRSFYPPSRENQIQNLMQQNLPPMFQTNDVSEPTIAAYTPEQVVTAAQGIPAAILGGIFAQGLTDTGEFDLLQAIGLGTGDEREEYIKQYTPYIVLSFVGILLIGVGIARLVFNPSPLR